MQQGSVLATRLHMQMAPMMQHHQQQQQQQQQQQTLVHYDHHLEQQHPHPPVMDELLDHMFSFPPWSLEMGNAAAASSSAWVINNNNNNNGSSSSMAMGMDVDSMAGLGFALDHATTHNLFTMSLMPGVVDLPLSTMHNMNDHFSRQPNNAPAKLHTFSSLGSRSSGGSDISSCASALTRPDQQQSPPAIAPTWRQPYVGGVPPLPITLGQHSTAKDAQQPLLGKRGREEQHSIITQGQGREEMGLHSCFSGGSFGQLPQSLREQQEAEVDAEADAERDQEQQQREQEREQEQEQEQVPPSLSAPHPDRQSAAARVYGQHSGQGTPARPRVRARRGQATDPHSIAERLRRERIAERMKALQELVPNSNKTDKASMLDEIIDYVKFLQLQVKVLSMSRLGGAGAVAPLVADLPPEGPTSFVAASIGMGNGTGTGRNGGSAALSGQTATGSEGLALTERQVARLMEEDMGTAMQYLQSKGLCLMPISLATAISTNGATRSPTDAPANSPSH